MRKLLLALLLCATPAMADMTFPPAKYDIGGATIEEAVVNFMAVYPDASVQAVPLGLAQEVCDVIAKRVWGYDHWPSDATAANGKILYGCSTQNAAVPDIVYSYSPAYPWLALQIFRHEAGHILGWPGDHPQGGIIQ
jgi:hypothetical protein